MAGATFDLDAFRAARAEKAEPKELKLGEVTYTLPSEIPLAVIEYLTDGEVRQALMVLGGEEFAKALMDYGLTTGELQALFAELYGVTAGN